MLRELIVSTVMVVLTVLVHGGGLVVLGRLLGLEKRRENAEHLHPASMRSLGMVLFTVLALIGLHGIEIWLYGLLYLAVGAIHDLREAVYFSTITYGAIGYSDAVMAERWRLVSAIEGINGILMIGWSTALLIRVVGLLRRV
ncbi:potassium channel family protein [Sphingomonas sp. BN140010]|uniref:Potassium channel family protein n=1 Tax=Sphingomonas arvum TaxID=2992113 RepID=A0ABT3JG04_9SPHN|nr:potassium channel family protein [Sphingomonas sp. BN140010]MCW3797926.1 potassium channel family protein [Sphingomonas sp. BN140010]